MKLLNSKGFSLVETLVSIGLLGILGAITMSIFQDINSTQRSIEESQNLDLFTGEISSLLLDHDECTANFRGKTLNQKIEEIRKFKNYKNDQILYEGNDVIEGNAIGGKPMITTGADSDYSRPFSRDYFVDDITLDQVNENSSVALKIKFKKDKNRPGVAEIVRKINLFVDFGTEDGDTILSCYSDLSRLKTTLIEKACDELTGSSVLNEEGHCEIPTYKQTDCEAQGEGYHLVGFKKFPENSDNPKLYIPDCQKIDLATGYKYEVNGNQGVLKHPTGGTIVSTNSIPRVGSSGPVITGGAGGPKIPIHNNGFLNGYNVEGTGSGSLDKIKLSQFKPAVGPETGNPTEGSDLHCDNEFGTNPNGGKRYRNQYGSMTLTFTNQGLQFDCK